jgi:hypothetical protein
MAHLVNISSWGLGVTLNPRSTNISLLSGSTAGTLVRGCGGTKRLILYLVSRMFAAVTFFRAFASRSEITLNMNKGHNQARRNGCSASSGQRRQEGKGWGVGKHWRHRVLRYYVPRGIARERLLRTPRIKKMVFLDTRVANRRLSKW